MRNQTNCKNFVFLGLRAVYQNYKFESLYEMYTWETEKKSFHQYETY